VRTTLEDQFALPGDGAFLADETPTAAPERSGAARAAIIAPRLWGHVPGCNMRQQLAEDPMRARILVVDDDQDMCELLAQRLALSDFDVSWRLNAEAALALLDDEDFDVVITDVNLGGTSGLDLCRRFRENRPSTAVIMITGFGDMSAAILAIRAGANDFINKPVDMPILEHAIQRALSERHLREQLQRLSRDSTQKETVGGLIGTSVAMRGVRELIRRVAASDTTVLVSGESGTGKELVARAVHEQSGRSGQLVAVNCAAIPGNLLESELFGHVRGAFTDAKGDRAGLIEQANGGTLLLDEIGEMPLEMQPKLLRVLQERQVRRVGGNASIPMKARLIAATNLDLEEQVEAKRFREDLFYRLNVVPIFVPPLRARGNDVLLLAEHFVEKFSKRSGKAISGIDPEAQRKLLAYDWPGNVRQLENALERAVTLTAQSQIQVDDLPPRILELQGAGAADDVDLEHVLTLEQLERRQIERVLKRYNDNKTRAAKALGVDRRTLHRKLDRYGRSRMGTLPPDEQPG
jgi:two-component system response regulator HydG